MRDTRTQAAWVAALATGLVIVKGTRIGPVILVVSHRYGMGVHTGDLLSALPLAGALAYTVRRRHRRCS